jgi:restriction endonuclease
MDKFPDSLTRKSCIDHMTINQTILMKQTRKAICDYIEKYVEECNPIMIIDLPDRLWHNNKLIIISELLERFGKIKVKSVSAQADLTKAISDASESPTNIKKIIIEFPLNNE